MGEITDKQDNSVLNLCMCYLPPENSSRMINDYFDELLSQIYLYQNDSSFFICGDFNSRIGDLSDYNVDADVIHERNVIDTNGHLFIGILISSSCCVLNDRNNTNNNFTSISSKRVNLLLIVLLAMNHCFYFKILM